MIIECSPSEQAFSVYSARGKVGQRNLLAGMLSPVAVLIDQQVPTADL